MQALVDPAASRPGVPDPAGAARERLGGRMDYGRLPEDRLVAMAREGDPRAFAELVVRDRPSAYAQAMSLCGNAADAWDVVAESEMKSWAGISRFRGDCPYARWRADILKNAFLDADRRRSRRSRREVPMGAPAQEDAVPAEPPDPAPGPDADLEAKEAGLAVSRLVYAALARLNPHYRLLLMLVDMRRPMRQRQAAAAPGGPPQRRRSRYAAVLRYFRLLTKVRELRRAAPFREGMAQEDVDRLYEEIKDRRNAYDLKLFHAREAFRKAYDSTEGRP